MEALIEVSIVRGVRRGPKELEGLIDMKSLSEEPVEGCICTLHTQSIGLVRLVKPRRHWKAGHDIRSQCKAWNLPFVSCPVRVVGHKTCQLAIEFKTQFTIAWNIVNFRSFKAWDNQNVGSKEYFFTEFDPLCLSRYQMKQRCERHRGGFMRDVYKFALSGQETYATEQKKRKYFLISMLLCVTQ